MDIVIDYFSKSIREKLKNHVKKIILFGSKARGDANKGSVLNFVEVQL